MKTPNEDEIFSSYYDWINSSPLGPMSKPKEEMRDSLKGPMSKALSIASKFSEVELRAALTMRAAYERANISKAKVTVARS